jgi:hypothetical protein
LAAVHHIDTVGRSSWAVTTATTGRVVLDGQTISRSTSFVGLPSDRVRELYIIFCRSPQWLCSVRHRVASAEDLRSVMTRPHDGKRRSGLEQPGHTG